ncbi:MAG TPA: hypothetical protein VHP81_08835 [Lachnospiraceae bacterium]|nr:hypothetical protein [Lachnospiraceae bacterium]
MDNNIDEIISIFEETLTVDLLDIIISNSTDKDRVVKIKIRPILLNNQLLFQTEEFAGKQVFHSNDSKEMILGKLQEWFTGLFKQQK